MHAASAAAAAGPAASLGDYLELTKPRVVALILFTALAAMALAAASTGAAPSAWQLLAASAGIALTAGGAAVVNCLVERRLDVRMLRTRNRATAAGRIAPGPALAFAMALLIGGLALLQAGTNTLTMLLAAATFIGYAVVYTVLLKPLTPQNIVIGGASGAMPPVLGWTAVTGSLDFQPLLLFLIIFVWTPPHFWSLALYRINDYRSAGMPMLPVTHGRRLTRLHILLYSVALLAVTLLPFAAGMAGWLYLAGVLAANARFVQLAWQLWRDDSDATARRLFKYSCVYLLAIFAALLADIMAARLL